MPAISKHTANKTIATLSCHCGQVKIAINEEPEFLTACNCSLCRRLGTLWAYFSPSSVQINSQDSQLHQYIQGDKTLAVNACRNCFCVTHWHSLIDQTTPKMGINFRLAPETLIQQYPIRHLDGADTWTYIEPV